MEDPRTARARLGSTRGLVENLSQALGVCAPRIMLQRPPGDLVLVDNPSSSATTKSGWPVDPRLVVRVCDHTSIPHRARVR